jgi:hypothetical protein
VAPDEQDAEDGIPLLEQSSRSRTLSKVLDLEESSGDDERAGAVTASSQINASDQFLFIEDPPHSPQSTREKRENSV